MRKKKLVTTLALVTIVAVVTAATPAMAKKPTPPETVMVTIETTDEVSAGIATTTVCGGALPMVQSRPDFLRVDWGPGVPEVEMTGLPSLEGVPDVLDGCHGGLVEGSDDGFAGMLWLEGEGDGVRLFSRFDYTWEYGPDPKNPRKTVQSLLDFYEIDGILEGDFDWSSGGTLEGTLSLRNFHKVYRDSEWTDAETFDVILNVTIDA